MGTSRELFRQELANRREDLEKGGLTACVRELIYRSTLGAKDPQLVVEVGGHSGVNAILLFPSAKRRILMDKDDTLFDSTREFGVEPICTDLNRALPVATSCADTVLALDIIEHLWNTDGFLSECNRVLRPGGFLILSTPNLASGPNRILLALGFQPLGSEVSDRKIYGRPGTSPAGHLRVFTPLALRQMVADYGFAVRAMTTSSVQYRHPRWDLERIQRFFESIHSSLGSELVLSAQKAGPTSADFARTQSK